MKGGSNVFFINKDEECILSILDKHSDTVFRLAFMYLSNRSDAEDVVQEIFLKLFRANPAFNDEEHIKAWLITVTSNYCKDIMKSIWHKRVTLVDEIPLPINDTKKREVIKQVMNLPLKYRNVIYLYYYEGYSSYEIANFLSEKDATIRTRLKRGREILKSRLAGGFDDEE